MLVFICIKQRTQRLMSIQAIAFMQWGIVFFFFFKHRLHHFGFVFQTG